jgi:hypothetical protein
MGISTSVDCGLTSVLSAFFLSLDSSLFIIIFHCGFISCFGYVHPRFLFDGVLTPGRSIA